MIFAAGSLDAVTPEMRLLFCCARRQITPSGERIVRDLLGSKLDWDRLISAAGRHKMLPLLWWHIKPHAALVPAQSAGLLQRYFFENAGQMLRLSAELLELSIVFRDGGIVAVPYKGPALSEYLYANLALRQAGDLDLLVRRGDVERTRGLLLKRGYRPRHTLSRGGHEFMLRSRYSEEFEGTNGCVVELHWAFTNGDVGLPLDLDVLAPRLHSIRVGGGSVPMFAHADLLLILCIHGCKHRWDRLEWLCGVAELLRAHHSEIAWDALLAEATAIGARRMLLLGTLLAQELLDAPAAPELLKLARADRAVALLALQVPQLIERDIRETDGASNLESDLFRLRLRERVRDRVRFIWYRLTTPSRPESWKTMSIGARWFATHGFTRPYRVASKLVGSVWKRRVAARIQARRG